MAWRVDRVRIGAVALVLILLASTGCARHVRIAEDLPVAAEVSSAAFFPQLEHQCGPAALATLLSVTAVAAPPAQLTSEVYLPEREGSLQTELIAAIRRRGLLPVPVADLVDLLREIADGRPVLVLQNLGLDWLPRWHYAVAVGYDKSTGEIILRSGDRPRHRLPFGLFDRTWVRSRRWALVALPPGTFGASTSPEAYAQALAAVERSWPVDTILTASATALKRWPDSVLLHFLRGNALYALGRDPEALDSYDAALALDPQWAPAYNNRALVLNRLGRAAEAIHSVESAIRIGGRFVEDYRATREELLTDTHRNDVHAAPDTGAPAGTSR